MKYLNLLRKCITYPLAVVLFPLWAGAGFLMTNWEDPQERKDYLKQIKQLFQ